MTEDEMRKLVEEVAKEVVLDTAREVACKLAAALYQEKRLLDYFEVRNICDVNSWVDQLTMDQIDDFLADVDVRRDKPL